MTHVRAALPIRIRELAVRYRWLILIPCAFFFGLSVIFPQIGLLEWVLLIPALAVFFTMASDPAVKYRRLYGMGLAFFWVFYAVAFHWFLYMYPLDFAGMSHAASAVVVGFACLGLSLFQALGAALLLPLLGVAVRGRFLSKHPLLHPLLFACLWTSLEWWQAHSGWSGVPWARLSLGQAEAVAILQSASLFGSYLITFLIVLVGGLLTHLLLHPDHRALCGGLAAALFLANLGFGAVRMAVMEEGDERITAAAIQGNKSSLEHWNVSSMDEVMGVYGDLSRKAAAEGADIIVWPETSIPANIDRSARVYTYITELARECGVPILCGVFTRVEEGSDADYNSIVVALPDGIKRFSFRLGLCVL